MLEFGERVHALPDSHVLVHCHAGISRSTAAAAILMCQHAPGQEEAAFLKLLGMRKHGWPNTRMVEFADTLLERDGALLRGLLAYRRALLQEKPHLSEVIRNIGRGHELPVLDVNSPPAASPRSGRGRSTSHDRCGQEGPRLRGAEEGSAMKHQRPHLDALARRGVG